MKQSFSVMLLTVVSLSIISSFAVAETRDEMKDETCNELKIAETELNEAYNKIMVEYRTDPVFLGKLKKAQIAWISYRDAHIESLYPAMDKVSEYGSAYGMCFCRAKKQFTEERTSTLKQWLDGATEGDVCTGSIQIK